MHCINKNLLSFMLCVDSELLQYFDCSYCGLVFFSFQKGAIGASTGELSYTKRSQAQS